MRVALGTIGKTAGLLLAISVVVVAAVVVSLYWLYRLMDPAVMVVNESGSAITDLRVELSDGRRNWTVDAGRIDHGSSWVTTENVSDLFVGEVRFIWSGRPITYSGGGLATRGEAFVLIVNGDGWVETGYRYWPFFEEEEKRGRDAPRGEKQARVMPRP